VGGTDLVIKTMNERRMRSGGAAGRLSPSWTHPSLGTPISTIFSSETKDCWMRRSMSFFFKKKPKDGVRMMQCFGR